MLDARKNFHNVAGRPDTLATPDLLRRYFLNRADTLAFAPPWSSAVARAVVGDDLDALLAAHVGGARRPVWCPGKNGAAVAVNPPRVRLGTYSPAPDGTTVYGCVDFDGGGRHAQPLADPLGAALDFLETCQRAGLTVFLEKSGGGKGWHAWMFFAGPVPAALNTSQQRRQCLLAGKP
jgi:hypothetical protein